MYTGSCLCGGIRFRIEAGLGPIEICYCQQCRKASGSAFAANAAVPTAAFHVTSGADLLGSFESSPGQRRCFCTRCGSPIVARTDADPTVVRVRVGTINEPLSVKPAGQYYTAWKCNWWELRDDLPQLADE